MPHRELQIVFQKWLPVHFCKLTFVALVTISIVIVIVCQRSAVLLLPNIPNQSTKLLKAPAESNQFMRDSEKVSLNMINQPPRVAESTQFMMYFEKVSLNMINQPPRIAESNQFMRDSEKISQNMTNQPTKHLKSPWPAKSSQFMRESETVWVNVGPEMFVFSAYLDTRDISYSSKPRRVVALAMQNDRMKHALLYCHLTDSNGRTRITSEKK